MSNLLKFNYITMYLFITNARIKIQKLPYFLLRNILTKNASSKNSIQFFFKNVVM